MEMGCLFVTLAIFSSYYVLFSSPRTESVLHRLLSSSVLTCAQIILTELVLGLVHQLYLFPVIIVNLSISGLVVMMGRRSVRNDGSPFLRKDLLRGMDAVRASLDVPAAVLGSIVLLAYAWVLVASYYLPPRGIDDLAYHLPAVFEYVRSHEIRLLPVTTMQPFAYPENAELLFLWPVLFTHDQRMVDGANVPFVLLSVLTIYALLRRFSLSRKNSVFAALLYALCPVVLMQAGVNYVDIIVSLFLLLSLYFALLYHEHRRPGDLFLAGLTIGLMCGMKYTAPFLALPLQLLILTALPKGKWRHALGYVSVIVLAGGWWYLRNAVMLGEPLYPMHFQSPVPDGLVNARGGSVLQNIGYNLPYWLVRYPLLDSGVGTYDGGFGLVFWGMCFSSWIYATFRSTFTFRRPDIPKLVVLAYLPSGFLLLLAFPPRVVDFNGRLAMFVVAIGLFAFGEVLQRMANELYRAVIKGICIALSLITVSLLFVSVQPGYLFGGAMSDRRHRVEASEFKYLAGSAELHSVLRPAWEALDLLTRDDPAGLNCLVASDPPLYSPSPVYGSRLQNRVLNMSNDGRGPVDAYVCTYLDKDRLEHPAGASGAPTIRDIMAMPDYLAVVQSEHCCLMLRRTIFEQPEKQRVLRAYYRAEWPEAVKAAERLDTKLDANIAIIASGEIGYGVRCIDMEKKRPDRVYVTPDKMMEVIAERENMRQCYTFQRPLSGYRSRKIWQGVYQNKDIEVYLNRRS